MPHYSETDLREDVRSLFTSARENRISPLAFCRSLAELGVNGALAMLYVRDAFGLPLETAKALVIEAQHGSVESWATEIGDAIDEL
jgi:hypothetical protein